MRDFDHVTVGTRMFSNGHPETIYSVSDFTEKAGVTVLILTKLDANGFGTGTRKRHVKNTDRAQWTETSRTAKSAPNLKAASEYFGRLLG